MTRPVRELVDAARALLLALSTPKMQMNQLVKHMYRVENAIAEVENE